MPTEIRRMQLHRGTAAAWATANTVLLEGEEGLETDTGRRKVGDGVTAWSALPYAPPSPHAASHTAGGAAAITVTQGQVTGLTGTLDGKVSTGDSRLSDARTPVDGSVTTSKLADGAVTLAKLGGDVPTTANLATEVAARTAGDQASAAALTAGLATKAAATHAASHAAAGADPVTLAQAQITGLTVALSGKADLVSGVVPNAQLPPLAITDVTVVANQAAMLALPAERGDVAVRQDTGQTMILASNSPATLGDWREVLAIGQVVSVAGKTGVVALTASDITSGTFPIARLPVGQTAGTVTAGDDNRFGVLTATDTTLAGRIAALEAGVGTPPPGATIPGAPTGVTAAPGVRQAGVTFTPPASNGGAAITSYRVTASTGQTATGTASPILVTGLTAGVAVTFTVAAANSAGTGPASTPSPAVTPTAPPAGQPGYVGQVGAGQLTATGTTLTITTTGQAVAGDSILIAVCCNGDPGAVTVTDTSANAYRLDGAPVANGTATSLLLASCLLANTLNAGATITVTFGAARTLASAQAHVVTGLPSTALDGIAVGTANSATAMTTGTMTTTTGPDLVFAAFAMASGGGGPAFTAGSGWAAAGTSQAVSGGSSRDMFTEWRVLDSAGPIAATATVGTAKNYAAVVVAFPPTIPTPGSGSGATGTYSTFSTLQAAASVAVGGDTITLAPTTTFNGRLELSGVHGIPGAPVVVVGPRSAVLDAGSQTSGYGLALDDCSDVIVRGFTVTNAQKGIMLDRCTDVIVEQMEVHHIGMEGIHLRNETTHCKVRDNYVHDTGLYRADFGEGLYCGTAQSNWDAATRFPAAMSGYPDHSDFNEFTGNRIERCTAEAIDVKEGTVGGVIAGNTWDGSLIAGANSADSWVDVKGESWTVTGNTGTTIMTDGYQTHRISFDNRFTATYTDGLGVTHPGVKSGSNNVFDANVSHCSPATGYGIWCDTNSSGNVVYTNNSIDGAAAGRTNITETVKPGAFPAINTTRSLLPWNSGAFFGGTNAADATGSPASTLRATPMDVYLTFPARSDWTQLHTVDSSWAGFPGVVVISVPPQPQGQSDAATAAGSNNNRWAAYGTALTAAGLNRSRTVIRLGWEQNGDWYDWAWGGTANTPAQYVAAVKNVVTAIRSTAPNVKINSNFNRNNKRSDGTTWQSVMTQLIGYVDIIGLDTYDMYNASPNLTAWNANQLNQDPGLASVAAFCRSNGLLMSLDEWAPVASTGADGTGGGDNPFYITQMWEWLSANTDVIAYESFYDHIGTNDYNHLLTDGSKPNAAAAYRSTSRWGKTG